MRKIICRALRIAGFKIILVPLARYVEQKSESDHFKKEMQKYYDITNKQPQVNCSTSGFMKFTRSSL